MGYSTRAEYTIELIRNPKAYDHIGRHYFATGFILASKFNEHALQLLLEKWQQIDAVTSNRVRFLFFIDNETTLGGYPNRPYFTESGYKRHNVSFLETARKQGFELSVKAGTQQRDDPWSRDSSDWYPQERVRKLAQQLGITSLLPCLVWFKHDNPEVIYVKRLEPLSADDIFALIRLFCDEFYDDNVDILSQIDHLEFQIENYCGQLDLSLKELDHVAHLLYQRSELNELLRSVQNLSLAGLDWAYLLDSVSEISGRVLRLHSIQLFSREFQKNLAEIKKWVNRCERVQQTLTGKERIPVPHLADALLGCFTIEAIIPVGAMRFGPSVNTEFNSDIFSDFLKVTAFDKVNISDNSIQLPLRGELEKARGFVSTDMIRQNESVIALSITKQNIVTLVNIRKILYELIQNDITNDVISAKDLYSKVDKVLKSLFHDTTLALAITFRLWIYSELRETSRQMENKIWQQIGTIDGITDLNQDPIKWQMEVQGPLQQIDRLSSSLVWNALTSYTQFRLSEMRLALLNPGFQPKTEEIAEDLSKKINDQLLPIGQAISQLNMEQPISNISSQIEEYQRAFPFLMVSAGTAKIFVSYRRDDSGHATDRIYEKLVERFGQAAIFMDVQIPLGVNFRDYLEVALNKCVVQLVVIGQKWLDIRDQQTNKRRLDDPNDLVRIEIERALKRQIVVIPVLIDGASIPSAEQLPLSLSSLADQQGIRVGRGPEFYSDMDRLIRSIEVFIATYETEALKVAQ